MPKKKQVPSYTASIARFKELLEQHSAIEVSILLRTYLLTYIRENHVQGFDTDFAEYLEFMTDLFEVFDVARIEQRGIKRT